MIDTHDLAGRAHLGAEHRVDDLAGRGAEAAKGQDRRLDGDGPAFEDLARVRSGQNARLAQIRGGRCVQVAEGCENLTDDALASCTPVALEAKGTVREARGLASMT